MTPIEEADRRVAEAQKKVLDFLRNTSSLPHNECYGKQKMEAVMPMVDDMRAAERARAALDKPKLMTPLDAIVAALAAHGERWSHVPIALPGTIAIKAVCVARADILAQAKKLPRYFALEGKEACRDMKSITVHVGMSDCIALADLENLIGAE